MDIDLDFSGDQIESFLSTKLEEIRLKNESLDTVLNQHKHALQDDSTMNEISFRVLENECWKRIFNNKYAIGYVIESLSEKDYKDIRVFLTWDSEETLCYKVETFGAIPVRGCKDAKNCTLVIDTIEKHWGVFRGKTYLVVIFEVPQYLYKLEYNISGNFVCNVDEQDFNISLPKVNVSAKNSTSSINENSLSNIFSIITCLNQTDLVMILPDEWTASLISTFEIHCALTYLKIAISCKFYFIAYDASKLFNNSLIIVHPHHENRNILFLNVYATNNDQIYALCHHLGISLPDIVFFPLSYYESHLCKTALFSKELLDEFARSMKRELEYNYKFTQNSYGNSSQHFNQLRSNLSISESNTDRLFLKVSNMKY